MSESTLTDLIFEALKLRYDEKDRQAAEYLVSLVRLSPAVGANVGAETVAVPKAALDWLMGKGPDADGHWFGDAPGNIGRYWWRSRFQQMIEAAAPVGANVGASETSPENSADTSNV